MFLPASVVAVLALVWAAEPDKSARLEELPADVRRLIRNAALSDSSAFVWPPLTHPLSVGQIGRPPGRIGHIQQIIGEKEMLVRLLFSGKPGKLVPFSLGGIGPARLVRVGQEPDHWVLVRCRGIDTRGRVDGTGIEFTSPMKVTGTDRFATVGGGSRTVFVIEPADFGGYDVPRLYAQYIQQRAENRRQRAWQVRWAAEKRVWTDRSGKHQVEALYDDYLGDGVIRLLKEDGTPIKVPLAKLSEKDRLEAIRLRGKRAELEATKGTKGR